MAEDKVKAEDVTEKPVPDTQTVELTEAALEKVTGGGAGHSGGGSGTGKIKPEG
jgi:hypothetical protein